MKKDLLISIGLYFISAILITIYSFTLYVSGIIFWPDKTKGSLIIDNTGQIRGSYLIAQDFTQPQYFQGRPAIIFPDQCNVALYNETFKNNLLIRINSYPENIDTLEMLLPSGSLKDPYISYLAATRQIERIAKARDIDEKQVKQLIENHSSGPFWPFFQMKLVNVVRLNKALDNL